MVDSRSKNFDEVYQMVKEIGVQERHFNDLNSRYKTMASTWLIAVFGGCGFVLTKGIEPASLYIAGIGVSGSLGVYLLWLIDLRVYQQLLSACFIEGVKLELNNPWLPRVRINMMKSQPSGHVVPHLVWFYILGFLIPLIIAIVSLTIFLSQYGHYLALAVGIVILVGIFRITKAIFSTSNEHLIINDLFKELIIKVEEFESADSGNDLNVGGIGDLTESKAARKDQLLITQFVVLVSFVLFFFIYFGTDIIALKTMQPEIPSTVQLPRKFNYLAPDGSEIRLLVSGNSGGLAHCQLPVGSITKAVKHKTVDEFWYILEGEGEVWRKQGDYDEIIQVRPGTSLSIPVGTHFQFRNNGDAPLKIIITTLPPWPGEDEAVLVKGIWE